MGLKSYISAEAKYIEGEGCVKIHPRDTRDVRSEDLVELLPVDSSRSIFFFLVVNDTRNVQIFTSYASLPFDADDRQGNRITPDSATSPGTNCYTIFQR